MKSLNVQVYNICDRFLEKQSLYSFWFYVFWEKYLDIISNKKIITKKKVKWCNHHVKNITEVHSSWVHLRARKLIVIIIIINKYIVYVIKLF